MSFNFTDVEKYRSSPKQWLVQTKERTQKEEAAYQDALDKYTKDLCLDRIIYGQTFVDYDFVYTAAEAAYLSFPPSKDRSAFIGSPCHEIHLEEWQDCALPTPEEIERREIEAAWAKEFEI